MNNISKKITNSTITNKQKLAKTQKYALPSQNKTIALYEIIDLSTLELSIRTKSFVDRKFLCIIVSRKWTLFL